MYRGGRTLRSACLKPEEMNSVLPMFNPKSEKARKMTARLRRAEKMKNLIPFLILLGIAVLWLFSSSVSNQELTVTTKYVPIRNIYMGDRNRMTYKTTTSGNDEWGATTYFDEESIEDDDLGIITTDDMKYHYEANKIERVEGTKEHVFGNENIERALEDNLNTEETARAEGNKKDVIGTEDGINNDVTEMAKDDSEDGIVSKKTEKNKGSKKMGLIGIHEGRRAEETERAVHTKEEVIGSEESGNAMVNMGKWTNNEDIERAMHNAENGIGNKETREDDDSKNGRIGTDEAEREVDDEDGGIRTGQAAGRAVDRKGDRSSTTEDSGRGTGKGRVTDQSFFDDDEINYDSIEEDYL